MRKDKMLRLGLIGGLLVSLLFVGGCAVPEGTEGGFDWTIIVFLVLIFGVFYFLLIRPQRKRQKEHQQMMQELKRGDKVVTAGGLYGVVESISEDSVVIKVESGATVRVASGSVALRQEQLYTTKR